MSAYLPAFQRSTHKRFQPLGEQNRSHKVEVISPPRAPIRIEGIFPGLSVVARMKAHVRTAGLLVLVACVPLTSQFSFYPISILEAAKGRRGPCVDTAASPRRGELGRRAVRLASPMLMCGGASADEEKGEVYDFV